jgi:hypothetical protein
VFLCFNKTQINGPDYSVPASHLTVCVIAARVTCVAAVIKNAFPRVNSTAGQMEPII